MISIYFVCKVDSDGKLVVVETYYEEELARLAVGPGQFLIEGMTK